MPLSLYLLAVAVFAMGTSEFMLAGLLPDIATDLGVSVPTTGWLTSSFALGMVVGAPLTAALARRWPMRAGLVGFVGLFLAAHIAGALTDSFPVLLATRVAAAVANAGFLALALTAAGSMVPPGRQGRALAVLLSGTTLATVAGVPAGALVGALFGWRAAFWAVAVICVPAALGVLRGIPAHPRAVGAGPRLTDELAVLARPRLVAVLAAAATVNAATFGAFTFLAPLVTDAAGLGALWVPVVLMLFGAGSFAGVTVAGRFSDSRPGLVVAVAGPLLCAGWVVAALSTGWPMALSALLCVQGALSFALGSTFIARVLHEAAGAPSMSGSYATAALNIGAAVGPVTAAAAYGSRLGVTGPLWVAGALVAVTLLLAVGCRRVFVAGPTAARR
ncbi:Cmx/CmrA family chloramphenicol efflux MFS transporter [Nocardia sp. NPDC024068]|uniref:Cmx/CmrA family chloramphenicol efflux MFS transporter n=1 Tax=Nocardia sp. NPDC024068 TaxID=3157197 RepID=UPI0033D067FC